MTGHDDIRRLSAGYVLGVLEAEDRRAFDAHLSGCSECRGEVAAFAPIPGLLSQIDGRARAEASNGVVESAATRARSEWLALARSRRRWQWVAALLTLVVLVIGGVALTDDRPDAEARVLAVDSGSITGEVALESRAWGTALHIELAGLPQRDDYAAWVVDDIGNRQQAAAWGPTPAGIALLDGASSVPADRVFEVVVTAGESGETLVSVAARQG